MAAAMKEGDRVCIPDKRLCFRPCTVKSVSGGKVTCFDENYTSYTVNAADAHPVCSEDSTVDDNTQLVYLNDASLLDNVRRRYEADAIYTYTANMLIAVNPYRDLALYGPEQIARYAGAPLGRHPPHVYAIANRAFAALRATRLSQSIVVSGESGAGKTEACKYVMRFLADVGGLPGAGSTLERRVLDANPVLEAFGNAKTVRNNNSSRFGKFTELHFARSGQAAGAADGTGGSGGGGGGGGLTLSGASIATYLFEKSRLVSHARGERCFHIFYQLAAAAAVTAAGTAACKVDVHLGPASGYRYLTPSPSPGGVGGNGGGGSGGDDVDNDAAAFAELDAALASLGVDNGDRAWVWAVLAALLHLGNVDFAAAPSKRSSGEGSALAKGAGVAAVADAASLLGVDGAALSERLTRRTVRAGGEEIAVALSPHEAAGARDALAKFAYGELFRWLVARVNAAVPCDKGTGSGGASGASGRDGGGGMFIGLLDISGFEIFETNSYEQLLINFCNEKIQQYFNAQTLQQEQQIYELEGLRYRKVDWVDNQELIDVIERASGGVLALLDEACVMPKADVANFALRVHTTHSGSEFLGKPVNERGAKRRLVAAEGCYEVEGFLAKNNDTIHNELLGLLRSSSDARTASLGPPDASDASQGGGGAVAAAAHGPAGGRFKSVGARFKAQLAELVETLRGTSAHFVRCVKPNAEQAPKLFDPVSVMTQLRYSGMCAALRLLQAGFPTRVAFDDIHKRFSARMPPELSRLKPVTFCESVLVALDLTGGRDFQMGLTKVFFRPGKFALLDELTLATPENVDAVVAKVRRWLARKRFAAAARAVVAAGRLARLLAGVRNRRRFQRAAGVVVRLLAWVRPALARARDRLYSSEVLRRRREEEEARAAREKAEAEARAAAEAAARVDGEARIREEEERRRAAAEVQTRELEAALRRERHAHEDTAHARDVALAAAERRYRVDVGVKDAVIASLKQDRSSLYARLEAQAAQHASREAELGGQQQRIQDDLNVAVADRAALTEQKRRLMADLARETAQRERLQRERENLIDKAMLCQTVQLKLRNIYSKFKKISDLVTLIYGDTSYATLDAHSTKSGALMKQGHHKQDKWEMRHVVLTDVFLLYFGSKKDSTPKGIVRMDQATAEKWELKNLKVLRDFVMRVTDTVSGREYFFGAASAEERDSWVAALELAEHS